MNVKTVFLYEIVNEKIYVKIFHNYITNKFLMCRLRKALYELKQAFRVWFEIFGKFLKKLNFLFFNADQNVFCDEKFILIIYVNDLFIIDFNKQIIKNVKIVFNKRFHMTNLDFITHYLSMHFERNRSQRIL